MYHWLTQSYWRDEAFSILLTRRSFAEIIRLSAGDFSPPLYHFVLKMWISIFGESEVATRLLSVLCFSLMTVVLIFFVRTISKASWVYSVSAVLILTLSSPLLVYYAFEARMYAMTALFAALSYYFFLRKNPRLYLTVTIAGIYTHYFMLIIVGTQWVYALLGYGAKRFSLPSHLFLPAVGIRHTLLAMASCIPWVLLVVYMRDPSSSSSFWIPKPNVYEFLTVPAILATGFERGLPYTYNLWPLTYALGGIIAISLLKKNTRHYALAVVLTLWAFVPALLVWVMSQFATPLFLPRYLIVSAPGLLLMLIIALHRYRPPFRFLGLALLVGMLWSYQVTQIRLRNKYDLKSVIQTARTTTPKETYLMVTSILDYHLAQVYWHDPEKVKIIGASYKEIPSYVGKVLIPKSAVISEEEAIKQGGYVLSENRILPLKK